jgi:hypothetical protein
MTEIGGSTAPWCSASHTRSQRLRAPGAGRNQRSNIAARLGSSVPLIAAIGMSRTPRWLLAPARAMRSSP